jgi:hypothetical protein
MIHEDVTKMNAKSEIGLYGDGIFRISSSRRMRPIVASSRISPSRRKKPIVAKARHTLTISVLIACTAMLIAASVVLSSPGRNDASQPKVPASISLPGPPYFVIGFTWDAIGNPLPNCQVNITDERTGDWDNTTLSDSSGYYRFSLDSMAGGWQVGDIVNATVYYATSIGWNETLAVSGPHLWLNVTLNGMIIPEFTDIAIPIVGMLSAFAVAMVASRRDQRKES